MTTYLTVPIETDPDQLAQDAYDYLTTNIPGWEPSPAHVETWLIGAFALIAGEVRDVASAVPDAIFKFLGQSLLGLPPVAAASASTTSTWTVIDTAGYVIPAGTTVVLRDASDNPFAFEVAADVTIAPGSSTTLTGGVTLVAIDPGTDANGLTAPVDLVDALSFVSTITLVAPTSSGANEESDTDYLNRLTTQLQLLTPRPIIPSDFAALSRNVAGVQRALAIDGYNPGDNSTGNERMVAVAVVDVAGAACSSPVKAAVDALLQSKREVNFVVNVMDPTFSLIDVTCALHRQTNQDATVVHDAVVATLTAYLSPANWGVPFPPGDPREWVFVNKVRYLELAQVINDTVGVDYIDTLTFREHSGSLGTTDVTMAGQAPLPRPNTLTITVT